MFHKNPDIPYTKVIREDFPNIDRRDYYYYNHGELVLQIRYWDDISEVVYDKRLSQIYRKCPP